jgi:hypothetical protein
MKGPVLVSILTTPKALLNRKETISAVIANEVKQSPDCRNLQIAAT